MPEVPDPSLPRRRRRRGIEPAEVVTNRAGIYPAVLDQLLPGAFHNVEKYAQQRRRGRPRTTEGPVAANAAIEAGQVGTNRRGRSGRVPE
jgi:hypothetical protein